MLTGSAGVLGDEPRLMRCRLAVTVERLDGASSRGAPEAIGE